MVIFVFRFFLQKFESHMCRRHEIELQNSEILALCRDTTFVVKHQILFKTLEKHNEQILKKEKKDKIFLKIFLVNNFFLIRFFILFFQRFSLARRTSRQNERWWELNANVNGTESNRIGFGVNVAQKVVRIAKENHIKTETTKTNKCVRITSTYHPIHSKIIVGWMNGPTKRPTDGWTRGWASQQTDRRTQPSTWWPVAATQALIPSAAGYSICSSIWFKQPSIHRTISTLIHWWQ